MFERTLRPVSLVFMASMVACSGFEEPAAGPKVVAFEATPQIVQPGGRSLLEWEVDQAVSEVRVETVDGVLLERFTEPTGSYQTGVLDTHTVFVLRVVSDIGETGASVLVQVNFPEPQIQFFSASDTTVEIGQAVLLAWTATAASNVSLTANGVVVSDNLPVNGSSRVVPEETTSYVLLARGPGGLAQAELTVTVTGALPVIMFEASPERVRGGRTSTLSWSVTDASRVIVREADTVLSDSEELSGSVVVQPARETEYVLTAENEFGSRSSTVTVEIRPEVTPTIDFFVANPNPVARGQMVNVEFATTEADTVRIFYDGIAVPVRGNTASFTANDSGELRLLAENEIGQNETTLSVFVHDTPRIDVWQTATQVVGSAGDVFFNYDVSSVAELVVLSNGVPVDTLVDSSSTTRDVMGSAPVFIAETTEVELRATSAAGQVSRSILVLLGTVEVEPNDAAPQVLTATAGVVGGTIQDGDVDRYTIDVPDDGSVFAETWTAPGRCNIDTQLSLLSPTGTLLELDDDDGIGECSQIDGRRDASAIGLPAGRYELRVEVATATAAGFYALVYSARAPVCGDGRREGSETCDDGNITSGDGCSSSCDFEFAATLTAPGGTTQGNLQNGIVAVAVDVVNTGSSIGALAADPGGVTCGVDTRVRLTDALGNELGRRLGGGPGNCAALDPEFDPFAADLAPGRYVVVADLEAGTGGPIELTIQIAAPACGNRITEQRAGEQCDDGNLMDGDGCSALCALESPEVPETEPNDTQAGATATGLFGAGSVTLSGMTQPSGDDDVFRLRIPAGQTLNLSARTFSTRGQPTSCDRTLTDTRLFVEALGTPVTDPSQPGALAYNDDIDNPGNVWCSGVSNVSLTGGVGGTDYFVRIQGWQDTALATYFLDLTLTP